MGISSTTNRVSFIGDGSSTIFPFPYYFFTNQDLNVFLYDINSSIVWPQQLSTNYSISAVANAQGVFPLGGNVVFNSAVPTTMQLVITRSPSFIQNFALPQNGSINSAALVQQLDYLTAITQRLEDQVSRAVTLPDGEGTQTVAFSPTLPQVTPALLNANAPLVLNSSATGWTYGLVATGATGSTAVAYFGTLPVVNGGTGQNLGLNPYGMIYALSGSSMACTQAGPLNTVLISTGSSSPPTWAGLAIGSGVVISFGVQGILPVDSGGTGVNSSAFQQWAIPYMSSATLFGSIPPTIPNYVLTTQGSSIPAFQSVFQILSGSSGFAPQFGVMYASSTTQMGVVPSASAGTPLIAQGSASPKFMALPIQSSFVSGNLATGNGGLGNSSFNQYQVLYMSTATSVSGIPYGQAGFFLQNNGSSAPSWAAVTTVAGNVTNTSTNLVTNNGNNKIIAASSLYTIFLYKPSAGDAGKELEVINTDNSLQPITIQGSNCTIAGGLGVVNSTTINTIGETLIMYNDGNNWYAKERTIPMVKTMMGSSIITVPAGAAAFAKGSNVNTDIWSYWREGEFLCGDFSFWSTSAGAAGGGPYLIQMGPSPLKINTNKVVATSSAVIAQCVAQAVGTAAGSFANGSNLKGSTFVHDSTTLHIMGIWGSATDTLWGGTTDGQFSQTNLLISCQWKVPIAGWNG